MTQVLFFSGDQAFAEMETTAQEKAQEHQEEARKRPNTLNIRNLEIYSHDSSINVDVVEDDKVTSISNINEEDLGLFKLPVQSDKETVTNKFLGHTKVVKHKIEMGEASPIRIPARMYRPFSRL